MNPFACLAPRSANRQGVTRPTILCLVGLLPFALLLLGVCTGCGTTSTTAANVQAFNKAALAKVGPAIAKVETPTAVQMETQIAVSEYLQRGVPAAKQGKDAQLFTFVAQTFTSFDGTTIPTVAEVEARVQSQAGTITDPDFPLIVGVGLDAWTMARQVIPANATTATVKSYLDAAAAGTIAGASGYLPKTAEAP